MVDREKYVTTVFIAYEQLSINAMNVSLIDRKQGRSFTDMLSKLFIFDRHMSFSFTGKHIS